jgi:hypothetical protein
MLESINYAPILKTKIAELNAYRNLSDEAKTLSFPIFLARPWPNATHLELTKTRVLEAVDGHPFAFGLDSERQHHFNVRPAQQEFQELFVQTGGYRNYYDFVCSMPQAVPVLMPSATSDNLLRQLGNADTANRGLIVHFTRESFVPVLNLAATVPPLPHDTVFVVDAGWSRNYELLELWATSTLTRILSAVPNAEIVIASSSFPESFGDIVGNETVLAHEYRLFRAMRQHFNQANMTFGDWGSTRKSQEGGGGKIPARIDVPHGRGWEVFRADVDLGEDYDDVAGAVVVHASFSATPECYGKEMIRNTPGEGGITGPARATESRINIHLTVRSDARNTLDTDDTEYED